MGIRPNGGTPISIPADNVQSRWGAWEAELSDKGDVAGEVVLDTWSLANSANTVANDANETAKEAIDEGNRLNDELGALIEEGGTDPLNLWRIQERINESNSKILAMHDLWFEQIREQLREQVEANKRRVNVAMVSKYGSNHPDVTVVPQGEKWRVQFPVSQSAIHAEWFSFDDSQDAKPLTKTLEDFRPLSTDNLYTTIDGRTYIRFTWAPMGIRQASSSKNGGSTTPPQATWVTVETHTISPAKEARFFAAVWTVNWKAVNRGSTYRARIVTSGGTVLAEWGSASIGPWSPLGDGRYTMRISCQNKTIPAGQDILFQVYTSGNRESQRAINTTLSDATWIEDA